MQTANPSSAHDHLHLIISFDDLVSKELRRIIAGMNEVRKSETRHPPFPPSAPEMRGRVFYGGNWTRTAKTLTRRYVNLQIFLTLSVCVVSLVLASWRQASVAYHLSTARYTNKLLLSITAKRSRIYIAPIILHRESCCFDCF